MNGDRVTVIKQACGNGCVLIGVVNNFAPEKTEKERAGEVERLTREIEALKFQAEQQRRISAMLNRMRPAPVPEFTAPHAHSAAPCHPKRKRRTHWPAALLCLWCALMAFIYGSLFAIQLSAGHAVRALFFAPFMAVNAFCAAFSLSFLLKR